MKQYKITNPKYSGEAVVTYNKQGLLNRIDTSSTNMSADVILHFKAAVPATLAQLEAGIGFTTETKIIEADYKVSFEDFWAKYPHKRNSYKVQEVWNRMSNAEQVEAYLNIDLYVRYCRKENSWYKPMLGDRYLRSKEYKTDWNNLK